MWKYLTNQKEVDGKVFTRNPMLIVSLSTSNPQYIILYSQARELASYLQSKLRFDRFFSFYSSALPPAIQIKSDGTLELAGVHFYHHYNGKRDIILLSGQSSPMADEYEFSDQVLSFAEKLGVRDMVSIGARWSEDPISPFEAPKVIGFSSDIDGVEELKTLGVEIQKEESAYFFANTIVSLATKYSIRGFKLSVNHGEPRPHPKSLIALLTVLSKLMREEIELSELESSASELDKVIRSAGYDSTQASLGAMQQQQGDIYR